MINKICVLADEVYQRNIYAEKQFVSMRKTLDDLGDPYKNDIELVSFHSTSKGLIGEWGLRGGYMELHNIDEFAKSMIYKSKAVSLCSNTIGQIWVGLMVNPPNETTAREEVVSQYKHEEQEIFNGLKRRAKLLTEALNSAKGITWNEVEGAMYAFPRIRFPKAYIKAAKSEHKSPDTKFWIDLLENTGIMVVPGSGFGQVEGTYHFRITNLVNNYDEMWSALDRLKTFTETITGDASAEES